MISNQVLVAAVTKTWCSFPQIIRFGISGTLGNVVFFYMNNSFYNRVMLGKYSESFPKIVNKNAESVSFFICYLGQIVVQHIMNAALVFGLDSIRGNYLKSLIACYSTYATTLVASTFFNAFLIDLGLSKNIAFWVTLYGFGVINFFLLSLSQRRPKKKLNDSEHDNTAVRGGAFLSRDMNIKYNEDSELRLQLDLSKVYSRSVGKQEATYDIIDAI